MADTYNGRLKPGAYKGVLGASESHDTLSATKAKVDELAALVAGARHVVVHTGAGISVGAGIADFRSATGVWTAEAVAAGELDVEDMGKVSSASRPPSEAMDAVAAHGFRAARPTYVHRALSFLVARGIVAFIVSQNVDGLHLRAGTPASKIAELHGNVFKEWCAKCGAGYVGKVELKSVGFKPTGRVCLRCRGPMLDCILDWDDALPANALDAAIAHSRAADLSIVLGSSLQIAPARGLPVRTTRKNGKAAPGALAVVNLQPTCVDRHAAVRIGYDVQGVMAMLMERLGLGEALGTWEAPPPVLGWIDAPEAKAVD
ncbi:sirtuin 6 [Thecamonas trahens ATCC 50062]|uniref:protein acetyllysine N-acetyltransferase n=1 Tax=Thecamonas trahens ATCC 50062 TaxID=461836 RepID=A0A0L0DH28_THETB|nr:sirtuin 6 [Thecamonas trahens ATCC 50062]KNC51617.1 sirtuin 6 [Thecamonas trahens ATCC 50062]|eukprot:XP_013756013.1 sirtuin 6 [Thecamonas trahens ATCC 50062]